MSDIVIKVENLGKKYLIRHQQRERYTALRDVLANKFKSFGKRLVSLQPHSSDLQPSREEFWALKDVSFEVKQGDRIGIIGRNGAGKTTLLKLLSRITEPTTGRIFIKGRVASLLEVGTGFHPELTGRENIFLNGAILGMSKAEIKRKFDEIVDFAEIEKFLDTPVKRYSSGMYVRLAFAVAAHLEPEILLVDEVLAVGDAQFQKKCLGKMEDVSTKEGRTVIFVSHNMGAITQLCSRSLLLNKGNIAKEGDTKKVIDYYLNEASSENYNRYTADTNSEKDIFITKAQALNCEGKLTSFFTHKDQIAIAITCKINRWIPKTLLGFFVKDQRGRKVFTTNVELDTAEHKAGEMFITAKIPSNILVPGQYMFTFAISVPHFIYHSAVDLVEDALTVTVIDGGSKFSMYEGLDYGCVFVDCEWNINN